MNKQQNSKVQAYVSVNKNRLKIYEDNKVIFIIEGSKLTSKQKEFLYTIDGVNFLLQQFKVGIKSFNALKIEIKKILENKKD